MVSEKFLELLSKYGVDTHDIYLLARQAERQFYAKKELTFMEKAAAYACYKGGDTGWMGDDFLVFVGQFNY